MKLIIYFLGSTFAANLNREEANSFLSRKRRGILSTVGKGAGLMVGAKAANSVWNGVAGEEEENDNDEENENRPNWNSNWHRVRNEENESRYSQAEECDSECVSEREETREEPEEEREGPFNMFGWFRG